GVVVARTGPHHAAASSPAAATAPGPGPRTPARRAARGPPAAGAGGTAVAPPQGQVAGALSPLALRGRVGGTGLRQVPPGAVSGPLPGLPDHGRLVINLVAGPGAAYAFDVPCPSSSGSVRVYRIVAGAAHRLGITAFVLLGGPHQAWAVAY